MLTRIVDSSWTDLNIAYLIAYLNNKFKQAIKLLQLS